MRINVVLVTFNRKNCLKVLLNALEQQTVEISNVLILDNCSVDSTEAMLYENGYLDCKDIQADTWYHTNTPIFSVLYCRNSVNEGGSGGFAKVVGKVLDMPCDYVWIMDDDVAPQEDCLEKLLVHTSDKVRACIPHRKGENFQDNAWLSIDLERWFAPGLTSVRKTKAQIPLTEGEYVVCDMPFEGPLVCFDVLKKVGCPDKDFFIICDDTDYAIRISKETNIVFVSDARLNRQLAAPAPESSANETYDWKQYYAIRNHLLLLKKHGENWRAKYLNMVVNLVYWNLKAIQARSFKCFRVVNRAVGDAILGKKGKTVQPGEF